MIYNRRSTGSHIQRSNKAKVEI